MRRLLFIGMLVLAAVLLAAARACISLTRSVRSRVQRTGASPSDLTTSLVLERSIAQ
ncbi:MAG: hypothetical protein ACJ75L_08165 [Gaiellaceae bacterium]